MGGGYPVIPKIWLTGEEHLLIARNAHAAGKKSCVGGKRCNCDQNDAEWREDSGPLTDKSTLPVRELRFGDVDSFDGHGLLKFSGTIDEKGYHKLGKFKCYGLGDDEIECR